MLRGVGERVQVIVRLRPLSRQEEENGMYQVGLRRNTRAFVSG